MLNLKKIFLFLLSDIICGSGIVAAQQPVDTVTLSEVSVSAVKSGLNLRKQPVAASVIGKAEAEQLNISALKGISDVVPNFFIPDYGSRITSSIYVRGLGARMDQPAVGLNVDNVPFLNKDAYDFDIADIARIEMIRGPQSTLYGRNTMGGIINITTLSPLNFQGCRAIAEYGSGQSWRLGAGWYGLISDNIGLAANIGWEQSNGFFRNAYNGAKLDKERQLTGRIKLDGRLSDSFTLMNVLSMSRLRQGGYPYEYIETGQISYNDTCFYRRFTLNDGLTMRWSGPSVNITSVTSFQYIDDNMTLDQDFLPLDYFTLTQKKREWGLTQDVVAKGSLFRGNYRWLAGLFAFGKHLDMDAPVTFKDYGISTLIESHRNDANPSYPIAWDSRSFPLNSNFVIPTWGLAAYHESNYSLGQWQFTVGLRLDYEHASMRYHSYCDTGYTIYDITGSTPTVYRHVDIDINDRGHLSRHFLELLPKFCVLYNLPSASSNIYLNISKGYKAGGFNTQMFSDVLQQRLMNIMGIGSAYDVSKIVGYKPEKSWNYEIGAHLQNNSGALRADISLFYIDCTDQQLTMFPDGNTTGRIMTNAGKTRSFGGELTLAWRPTKNFVLNGSYGYTNAKFRRFFNGKESFAGKFIPYAPMNTIFGQIVWRIPTPLSWLEEITLDVNARATGRIYWNEQNSRSQNLYALLNASVSLALPHCELQLWARNITDTRYHTFYFVSIGNEFVQRGKPFRAGATLRVTI